MDVAEAVIVSKLAVYLLITLTGAFWGIIIIMLAWYLNMTYKLLMALVNRVTLLEKESVNFAAYDRLHDKCEWGHTAKDNTRRLEDLLAANKVVT